MGIQMIFNAWPEAVREKFSYGEFPLHLALSYLKNIPFEVIQMIINAWPEAVREKCIYGKFPLHRALEHPENIPFEVIQMIFHTWPMVITMKPFMNMKPKIIQIIRNQMLN